MRCSRSATVSGDAVGLVLDDGDADVVDNVDVGVVGGGGLLLLLLLGDDDDVLPAPDALSSCAS